RRTGPSFRQQGTGVRHLRPVEHLYHGPPADAGVQAEPADRGANREIVPGRRRRQTLIGTPRNLMGRVRFILSAALAAGLAATGCSKKAAGGPGGFPLFQVVAVAVKRQPVNESLSLIGSLAANEMVEIKSETDGMVQEIPFNEGQRVEKGQLLIQLDETKFATALAEAEGNFKLSRANFERAKQLFADKLISEQEYDQAAANFDVNRAFLDRLKREPKAARIYAPFSGIIGARNISPGQVIARNTVLVWLVDLDPIKVEFNVPERFLSQVQLGQALDL